MVHKCVVPFCKGNYASGPKVSTFGFPKDTEMKKKWIAAIHRKNYNPTKQSRVCEKHFAESDIEREASMFDPSSGRLVSAKLDIPRLRKGAVPSKIPGAPSYLYHDKVHRISPDEKKKVFENNQLSLAISESLKLKELENKKDSFTSLDELLEKIQSCLSEKWYAFKHESCITIALMKRNPAPVITHSLVISDDFQIQAFVASYELKKIKNHILPMTCKSIKFLLNILENLEKLDQKDADMNDSLLDHIILCLKELQATVDEEKNTLAFIAHQLKNLFVPRTKRNYESEFMVFFSLLFTISPHAYRFIRSYCYVILPHPSTVNNLCSKLNTNPGEELFGVHFLRYIRAKFSSLGNEDKIVSLIVDEIHIKSYFDYKGGNVVGNAFNSASAATSAHTFMVNSLYSSYKDVVHVLPVTNFNAPTLHAVIRKLIMALGTIGFNVLCVVTDNNSINGKAMSYFCSPKQVSIVYPNPFQRNQEIEPLFYVIDCVHILKCIRNNWIAQKCKYQSFYFPDFESAEEPYKMYSASFGALKKLRELEGGNLLKYGKGLSLKALYPTSLEKQNVKLSLQIFNCFVATALRELGEKHNILNYEGTAKFIEIISKWWNIINVKTPHKGKRFNDPTKEPLRYTETDNNVAFLHNFINWLDRWEKCSLDNGKLSKETHHALVHSTYALIELGSHCINSLKKCYFLPGSVQSDPLEARFGKYRQLAGSQYHISIRQIYESESKLRVQNTIKLSYNSNTHGDIVVEDFDIDFENNEYISNTPNLIANILPQLFVCDSDIDKCENVLPIIIYLAGYCVFSTFKNSNCDSCVKQLTLEKEMDLDASYKFIQNLNRGRLTYPSPDVTNAVMYNYIIVQKLASEPLEEVFLKCQNQRQLVCEITMLLLMECDFDFVPCLNGHTWEDIFKKIIKKSTNALLKNYCILKNDSIKATPDAKKRKMRTLKR